MGFASVSFIFFFLPLSLAVYYLAGPRGRVAVLTAVSLLFYFFSDPKFLWLMAASICLDYGMYRLMERYDDQNRIRRAICVMVVTKNAFLFLGSSVLSQLWGTPVPLGIAVYTLTSLGYLVDVYNGDEIYEHDLLRFALLNVFYGKLQAGPLMRYGQLREQLKKEKYSLSLISDGAVLFIQGLAKQVLLGRSLDSLYLSLKEIEPSGHSMLSVWLLTISLALSLYFNLSGFCDMARGLGKMYQLELPRNFYYPYQSRSITDFVGRFNSSVTEFYKQYIYSPLGADRQGGVSSVLNITLVTLLWGVWFGFRINYICWALYFTLFIFLERGRWGRLLSRLPVFFTRVYTFAVVLLSFVIFSGRSVSESWFYFTSMFGMGSLPVFNDSALYSLASRGVVLLLALLLSTSAAHTVADWCSKRHPHLAAACSVVFNVALLILTLAFILPA
ncbi:MAG: hypothetical protein PHD67_00290 [Oscillospiraceae bacterium]|nr:hypothetical protein [Oscillospiraceae bacterium]